MAEEKKPIKVVRVVPVKKTSAPQPAAVAQSPATARSKEIISSIIKEKLAAESTLNTEPPAAVPFEHYAAEPLKNDNVLDIKPIAEVKPIIEVKPVIDTRSQPLEEQKTDIKATEAEPKPSVEPKINYDTERQKRIKEHVDEPPTQIQNPSDDIPFAWKNPIKITKNDHAFKLLKQLNKERSRLREKHQEGAMLERFE